MTQTGNTAWSEEVKVGDGFPYNDNFVNYNDENYSYNVYEEDTVWTEELPN